MSILKLTIEIQVTVLKVLSSSYCHRLALHLLKRPSLRKSYHYLGCPFQPRHSILCAGANKLLHDISLRFKSYLYMCYLHTLSSSSEKKIVR